MDDDLTDTKQSILQGQSQLDYLKDASDTLTQEAQFMKDEITELQETNVEGALNLTREARQNSEEAARKVEDIKAANGPLANSEQNRLATQNVMKNSGVDFKKTQQENQETLQGVVQEIQKLENKIPGLNKQGNLEHLCISVSLKTDLINWCTLH